MKRFGEYLTEATKEVVFAFGRFNPPTTGHEKLIQKVADVAKKSGAVYQIYPSQSSDPKKNPLDFQTKVKFMRKMFPKHGRNIIADKSMKTAIDVLVKLYERGYNKVTLVVGGDRVSEFKALASKYNGVKARHGFYNFEHGINIVSAGERDPDAEDVSGMSASKMRAAAAAGDYDLFAQGLPPSFKDGQSLFNAVRSGMGLREFKEVKRHINLQPISEDREAFVAGDILNEGDLVVVKQSDEVAEVVVRGTNYVIVETADRKRLRKWITDVEVLEDVKKKITSSYDIVCEHQICEDVTQKQIGDLEKFADRLLNKFDVDVEFTRHFADRMNDSRNSPKIAIAELQRLFKKIAKNKAKNIKSNAEMEIVLKDIQSDLNLPVAVKYKDGEFEVINKTIMRKKDFKTSNKTVAYESFKSFI